MRKAKLKNVLFFYNHPIIAILSFIVITGIDFISFVFNTKWLYSIFNIVYPILSFYILCSVEIKLINYLGDLLDKHYSKIWNNYKVNSWKNLTNIERFYKINWKDDYLHDLLVFFDIKHILPSENQMQLYIDNNGNVNSILLYELLVYELQKLSLTEITTLKHYIELKSSKKVYQRNITLNNVSKVILIVSTIALILTISGTNEDITVGNVTVKNFNTKVITHLIAQVSVIPIMFSLLILILVTTIFISVAFYNAKHLRYADVIHQALEDASSIKANIHHKK
nr:hypothetical protein [Limosilactobacillus reuteri]